MEFPKFLKIVVNSVPIAIKINETTTVVKKVFDKLDSKVVDMLANALGFSYELVSAKDGELGRLLENGSWTGMIGLIDRGEADLILSPISPSEQRDKVVGFGYPYHSVRVTFATTLPEYVPQPMAFMYPFSNQVWISFIACLLLLALFLHAVLRSKHDFPRVLLFTYGTFLRQMLNLHLDRVAVQLLVGFWMVSAGILSYCYAALLLSFLTFPPLNGVRTINELSNAVKNEQYYCVSYPGTYITKSLTESSDPIVHVIGQDAVQNEGSSDIEAVMHKLMDNKKSAFIGGMKTFLPLQGRYFISDESFFFSPFVIAMRKDFCCMKHIDNVMGYVVAGGLYSKLFYDDAFIVSLKNQNLLSSKTSVGSSERKISLADMEGAFFLLICGYILAALVFALEFIFFNLNLLKH